MKKLVLSLVVLAGCSNAPVGEDAAPTPVSLASTGPADPNFDQPEAISPLSGLGATTTSVAPRMTYPSTSTTIVQPRPVQREVSSPSTTILDNTSGNETLRACIAHYESTSGLHPNIYQFTQGTWEAYGGSGSPSNASYAEQTRIFWLAWNDNGRHHWAAQKGRCF